MAAMKSSTAILVLALVAACGSKASSSHGGNGSGDAGSPHATALAIAPPQATVALAPAGAGFAATQAFTVTATFDDGSTADVTADAGLVAATGSGISFATGTATATLAGAYAIAARYGGARATAELDVTLAGSVVDPGVTAAQQAALDGGSATGAAPTIAYPPAGALFPVNVTPLEVHVHKSDPAQAIAKVTFTSGTQLAYSYYRACAPSPNPGAFPDACLISIAGTFAPQLAGVSETADVSIAVRLVAADGTRLGEAPPIAAAWARTPLSGGLYYWTTAGAGDTGFNTAIARYDFDGDASAPAIYLSSADAPAVPGGDTQCIGCHAVSPDGAKLSFGLGGSLPGYFSLYDVATRAPTASRITAGTPFANMATFNADGSRAITGSYGTLSLRAADASLAASVDALFPDVTESKSHPFWSPSGQRIAFVSWTKDPGDPQHTTGDMVQGGQIWMSDSDGLAPTGQARLLVPRVAGATSYYPAISDDDALVVFDRSSCSGPANTGGWGLGPCDGYNDISATLMVVPSAGGAPVALARANGGASPLWTNSWPRWSPDHGTFRGKALYWIAFSSRRPYGLALAGATNDTTKPQLWFTAIAVDPSAGVGADDPSYPAIWLPGQDPSFTGPRGNHTPVWTSKAVVVQ